MARTAPASATPVGRQGTNRPNRVFDSNEGTPRVLRILEGVAPTLGEVLCDTASVGLGVLISPTSDLGAISVTVYDGDEREKRYATDRQELEALLQALRDFAQARMG